MDIKSIGEAKYNNGAYEIETPSFFYNTKIQLLSYVVQRTEEMRIDLVMQSMYGDGYNFEDLDVILYINGIDNPLNIREGATLLYPGISDIDKFRYYEKGNYTENKKITEKLSVPNKTARKDSSREDFVNNGYSLPPVVLPETKQPVRVSSDKIIIGGL